MTSNKQYRTNTLLLRDKLNQYFRWVKIGTVPEPNTGIYTFESRQNLMDKK